MANESGNKVNKYQLYAVEGDKLVRQKQTCPRCGQGVFLAEHSDRKSCGRCGYTETSGGQQTASIEQPSEQQTGEPPKEESKSEETPKEGQPQKKDQTLKSK